MKTSTIILLATLAALMLYSFTDAKSVSLDDNSDEEMTQAKARMLLDSMLGENEDNSLELNERGKAKSCVRCKYGIFKCCSPKVCVTRTIRSNKCMKVKSGK